MSRTSILVLILAGSVVLLAASEPAKNLSLPGSVVPQSGSVPAASSPGLDAQASRVSLEQSLSKTQSDLRASKTKSEIRALSMDVSKIYDDVLHMSSDFQKMEDLDWKMSTLSRKIETALDRLQKLSAATAKDPSLAEAAGELSLKSQDLLGECRRLEIQAPLIRDQIGFSQRGADFLGDVAEAKQNAVKLESAAQALLALVK